MNIDNLHYLDTVRKIALALPEVEEYICFGTPAFRVKKKLLARMKEDGETLVVHCEDRDEWMLLDPVIFFITYHYRNSAIILVSLPKIDDRGLKKVVENGWKQIAPKKALKHYFDNDSDDV